ncbi:MAG: 16S rRNA (adenine(1518)-N(6)/adenine(1519)-N(6))-dimethyltransferase RsmA [Burkholderiales bacterium]
MRHIPRKRFGQHFLVDAEIIAAIIAAINVQPADSVVEIGPGLGALTQHLVARLKHLHVIEIDRDLAAQLTRDYPAHQLTVHNCDTLQFDFSALGTDLRVAGNLPYNISSPLLFHLTRYAYCIRDMHFMLQKEVVERMAAAPGSRVYGRLSVMLQYRYVMRQLLVVPASAFKPAPKVESAVIRLIPRTRHELHAQDEAGFAQIVTRAFTQRRKTLRNSLNPHLTAEDFKNLELDAGLRAENLSCDDFVRISNYLANKTGAKRA